MNDMLSLAIAHVLNSPQKYRWEFADWLANNWHIYRAFEGHADRVWARGRRHYSARTIMEVIRHETALSERPEGQWKINNNDIPDLARLYTQINPHHAGLFDFRSNESRVV